ncbi:MAG: OsmC family protein [Bdellovibrionales bacterium]|nr:OsmC family protein [Bdellovibrionales bacterium]
MPQKTVKVELTMGANFETEVRVRDHRMLIDQTVAAGGQDAGPSPLEYLLASLGGCICAIGRIVAHQRKINLRGMYVAVEGDLDTDVLLGKDTDKRAGFESFRISAQVDADLTDQEKRDFLHEVDRRCPVSENLQHLTTIEFV